MQASERDTDSEGRTPLTIRVKPSFKRRLVRMARFSDAGTLQNLVEDALTRLLEQEEPRLVQLYDAITARHYDGSDPESPERNARK